MRPTAFRNARRRAVAPSALRPLSRPVRVRARVVRRHASRAAEWLKTTLVQAAWAAVRTKTSYLRAQFHRIKARRGPKKAILAVASSLLRSVFFMMRDGVPYRDLGSAYFDALDRSRSAARLIKRLTDLGYAVLATPPVDADGIAPDHG